MSLPSYGERRRNTPRDGRLIVETGSVTVGVPPEDVRELVLEAPVGEVARADAGGGE